MNMSPPLKELVPVTPRGEATRAKLLASAEIEFGSKGFPAASVSSITQRADVGQGTFYLYFHSKEEVYATLVRLIGSSQCQDLAALAGSAAGQEIERKVVTALLEFVAEKPGRHRILREAQFVDASVFRQAQKTLFTTVAAVLAGSGRSEAGQLLRAAGLVGAAEHAAMQHCQWDAKPVNRALVEAVLGN